MITPFAFKETYDLKINYTGTIGMVWAYCLLNIEKQACMRVSLIDINNKL